MNGRRFVLLVIVALAAGLAIAWIDSRPGWDDTGISAAMVFLAAAVVSALMPSRAAVFALAVGAWIPLVGILRAGNSPSMLALPIAFAGAFIGALVGRQRRRGGPREQPPSTR